MIIARVRWTAYRVPFRAPYTTSQGNATHREGLLVELTSDDGRVGIGEAAPTPELLVGGDSLAQAFVSIAAGLMGQSVEAMAGEEPPATHRDPTLAALACAIDNAVCDLMAQSRGLSLSQFLRPEAAPVVPVNALIAAPDIVDAVAAAVAARTAGYSAVKLKVGMEDAAAEECARVAAVRKALGPDVKLRLDPNGAWDIATALEVLAAIAPLNIEYVEQPLPAGSLEKMRYVQQRVAMAIAADEDVTGFESALRIIETRAARVLVLKPQRLGGLRACREIVALAQDAGLECVVTTSIETGVGTADCLHLAAALPAGSPACGLATASLLESDLTSTPIPVAGGAMRVPDAAGLGVQLDHASVARYGNGWHEVC